MKIKVGRKWQWRKVQKEWTGSLSIAVLDFAQAWAEDMEKQFKEKSKNKFDCEIADRTRQTNLATTGLTNHMFACAVGLLSEVWVFGEYLRHWHNIKQLSSSDLSLAIRTNVDGGYIAG